MCYFMRKWQTYMYDSTFEWKNKTIFDINDKNSEQDWHWIEDFLYFIFQLPSNERTDVLYFLYKMISLDAAVLTFNMH